MPSTRHPIHLPPDTDARLGMIGGEFFVFLARPPLKADTSLLDFSSRPPGLTPILTHDAGCDWTDKRGTALAEIALDRGEPVVMKFERLADAMAAHRRVLAAIGQQPASGGV